MKLRIFLFIVFLLVGILAIIGYTLFRKSPGKPINNIIQTVTKPSFSIENAPSEAIKGTVTRMSGQVFWEARTATEAAEVNNLVNLQQGEQIQTGETGSMDIVFPNAIQIKAEPKTQIDFVQTLPVNFVASIASGSAEFKKVSTIPVTIRALHLLVKVNSTQEAGDLSIGIDEEKGLVNLNIISGSITVAFNDLNLVSKEVNFTSGQRVTFNDLTRSFE